MSQAWACMEKRNNVLYVNIYFMMKEKILTYEAPVVEVIEVEVEKGFASSSGDGENNIPIPGA